MPKVARKVAMQRSVPSAGGFISGKLLELSTEILNFAREAPALPGQRRLPFGLADQTSPRYTPRVLGGDRVRMTRIGGIVTGDDEGWHGQRFELSQLAERLGPGQLAQRSDDRLEVSMALHPFAGEAQHRVAPGGRDLLGAADAFDEAVDAVALQRLSEAVPVSRRVFDAPSVSRPIRGKRR